MGYKIEHEGRHRQNRSDHVNGKKITAVADHRGDDGAAGY